MMGRDLLGIEDLEQHEIEKILETAQRMQEVGQRDVKKVPTLRGRTLINLFFESSTRTLISFEIAGKRLSADVVNFSSSRSSLKKAETILDTAKTLDAMDPDAVVVRHSVAGVPKRIADALDAPVINAGDGAHEHPTQALLDAFTIRQAKGGFKGLRVTILGDILNSRVARSNVYLLTTMGAEVTVCGPPTLLPIGMERLGCRVTHEIDTALDGADVVMALRIQLERMKAGAFPTLREYASLYGVNERRFARATKDAIVMHPGPMNRGVEITSEIADGERSVILNQVTNGVAVRMAVLYLLAGETVEVAA